MDDRQQAGCILLADLDLGVLVQGAECFIAALVAILKVADQVKHRVI